MAAILTIESTWPDAEKLAMAAANVTGIPGRDPEFECATFDSDDLNEAQLQGSVFEALGGVDQSWRANLKLAE